MGSSPTGGTPSIKLSLHGSVQQDPGRRLHRYRLSYFGSYANGLIYLIGPGKVLAISVLVISASSIFSKRLSLLSDFV